MEIELGSHTCATRACGLTFWTTLAYSDRRRKDHETFYCPNGHRLHYPAKTDAELLRIELAAEKKQRAAVEQKLATCERRTRKKKPTE